MNYKNNIANLLKKHVNLEVKVIEELIEIPPKSEIADYAFPCFHLSKIMKKAPNIIAEELKKVIFAKDFEKIENVGPYLNFFIDKGIFSKNIIEKIIGEGNEYGSSNIGEGKKICIEYSSPNIAKSFHIGHLFTTVIGNSLYKIFKKQGYNVVGINHIGDWGVQFGKLISAYNRWVDQKEFEKDPINEMLRIYVKFHEESQKDLALEDEARANFKALECGDEKATVLWKRFRELSLKEFERIYYILNIKFDSLEGEAFFNNKMDGIIGELIEKGLLVESNGVKVVLLKEHNMPPCIVGKSDGTSIYATTDLAAAIYRKKNYDFYKCIYVAGLSKDLHFKQVFKVLELAGYDWAKDCIHVGSGLLKFADRNLLKRKGAVTLVDDLFQEAVGRTIEFINKKNSDIEDKKETVNKIAVGAVIFTYLKDSRDKDIVFKWDEVLSFEGETGPYVQCSYARGNSILNRYVKGNGTLSYNELDSKEEFELIKRLSEFEEAIALALDKLEPSIISRYVLEVSKSFNKFYSMHLVLDLKDECLRDARLNLVKAALQVIKNSLELLGIDVVEKM